ncbi:DUF924 family protein [Stakelama marina]|uniref:DUF924 domain-containing protein n=1 Tax=Stakelama marina TaxID=2826939 RepID=A0A8T4IB41_9SPHN|nr:DUF924 family protein [Stakelama marina]MBR0551877.1 DUF924 domain-containing protein [Stakelama marina]
MAGDLGRAGAEVHAVARDILDFWFKELSPEQWFAKDAEIDAAIARRFAATRDMLIAGGAASWRDNPETLLAAVIAIDQFSRNIHRGAAAAYAGDELARQLTLLALDRGWDRQMTDHQRQFLYMPLMHAEDMALQNRSVSLFESLGLEQAARFARDHHSVIERFGRFPSRNAALGRASTPEEQEYLSQPDAGW